MTESHPYHPAPLDVSHINLDTKLETLVEALAKNTHEIWAQTRIDQGWKFGSERNDAEKLHPCLISYEALPESEKVYDRNTVVGVLKTIQRLDYAVVPKAELEKPVPVPVAVAKKVTVKKPAPKSAPKPVAKAKALVGKKKGVVAKPAPKQANKGAKSKIVAAPKGKAKQVAKKTALVRSKTPVKVVASKKPIAKKTIVLAKSKNKRR